MNGAVSLDSAHLVVDDAHEYGKTIAHRNEDCDLLVVSQIHLQLPADNHEGLEEAPRADRDLDDLGKGFTQKRDEVARKVKLLANIFVSDVE